MDRDKKTRILVVIALIVSVLGLSVGYAAFSQTLTIKSSAEVKPDENIFNVDFSSNSSSVVGGTITPTLDPSNETGFTATDATIDNSTSGSPVIKNLHAVFTKPGQSATYSFYTKNAGELAAYLSSVTFNNASGVSDIKKCTAKNSADQTLVNSYCPDIKLKVYVGSEEFTSTKARNQFAVATAHDLGKNGYEQIRVVILYEQNATQPEKGFDVEFGDVVLSYTSNI